MEALRSREAAERVAAIKGRNAMTAPGEDAETGKTPEIKQHRVASSSAPTFTLTIKAISAYRFYGSPARWKSSVASLPPPAFTEAGSLVGGRKGRNLAPVTLSSARLWFRTRTAPTFVATYSLRHIPQVRIGAGHLTTQFLHRLWRALSIGALMALLIVPVATFAQEAGEARQMGAPKHHAAPAPSEPTGDQAKPDGAGAGPSEEAKASAPAAASPILPLPVITHHNIGLDGSNLSYGAKAGMLPLRDAQDKMIASIFYVAYWREPQDSKRPITFVFNGGPGAASAYLHLGAIGPKAVDVSAKGELLVETHRNFRRGLRRLCVRVIALQHGHVFFLDQGARMAKVGVAP